MTEMILPGTYIEVRAEGLIAAGQVSVSNVAVLGSARRGPTDEVLIPSDIGEAREIYGPYDPIDNPDTVGAPYTLVRALDLVYGNGAQKVFTLRVAPGAATQAVFNIPDDSSGNVVATATYAGSGYNEAEIVVESVGGSMNVSITVGRTTETWRDVTPTVAEFAQILNGDHPSFPYATQSSGGGSEFFAFDAAGASGNVAFGTAALASGGGGDAATAAGDYVTALESLVNENVHIVVLAGQTADELGASLTAHCENASSDAIKRERIGVIGDLSDDLGDIQSHGLDSSRMVFAAPGVRTIDTAKGSEVPLNGTYTAAALAGLISSLSAHFSPTNKTLKVNGVTEKFNGAELEQVLQSRAVPMEDRDGVVKVVQGITTSSDTAFKQITTRRIVDYAKFGVRSACDPYIGKLNNERVRTAMKGTINGFLADMIDQEMLISYELEVSATREQQIRGIAQVTMVLRPTFSIDYIRVIMYLE
ncbi:MAG: phage tail sheath C-terminal domain-containing protein [Chloroflexota bacterium]|jgi:hypothetical protein